MTEQEIIEKLKGNASSFGYMSGEIQEAAKKIGVSNFQCLQDPSGVWYDMHGRDAWHEKAVYRLKPNYTAEPDVIECEIKRDKIERRLTVYGACGDYGYDYTCAPGLSPKEGYVFVGYKYKDGKISALPVLCECYVYLRNMIAINDSEVVFPTHALYKRSK